MSDGPAARRAPRRAPLGRAAALRAVEPGEVPGRGRGFTARIALPPLRSVGGPDAVALASIVLFLVAVGLLMVLSASSVEKGVDGDPFGDFLIQTGAAALGLLGMVVVASRPPRLLLAAAPFVYGGAVVLQLLTLLTPLGYGAYGNRNWLRVAGVSVQPSELIKLGVILMLAAFFSRRRADRLTLKQLVPGLVPGVVAGGVVMAGHDLGTALVLAAIVFGGLLFAGVRLPLLGLLAVGAGLLAAGASQLNGSRTGRFDAWSTGCADSLSQHCWQSTQALWALANGGVLGVGIGNSVSKWFWLPEADNDFILAVIGEETGLVGLAVLIACFVALAVVYQRIAAAAPDPFTRVVAGMSMAWLVGQAFANTAVVLGLLPVFGVPLPFVSSGGSSMVANLLLVGVGLSLARAAAERRRQEGERAAPRVAADHPSVRGPVPVASR